MLVNVAVYDYYCHTTLNQWTILNSDERLNQSEFYERVSSNHSFHSGVLIIVFIFVNLLLQIILPQIDANKAEHTMDEVHVGQTKGWALYRWWLPIVRERCHSVIWQVFEVLHQSTNLRGVTHARNAFEIVFSAQRSLATEKYPPLVTIRNKRDKLFNNLLSLFKSKQLCWNSEEVHSGAATRTVQTLGDVL